MKTVYICTKLGPEVEPFYCDSLAQAVDRWLDSWACIGYRAPAELYADLTRHCPCSVIVCEVDDEKLAAASRAFTALVTNTARSFNAIMGLPDPRDAAEKWADQSTAAWLKRIGGLRTVAVRSEIKLYGADELFPIMLSHYNLRSPP